MDAIEVEMGRNFHEQLNELELGRADLVEVAPEQGHRVAMEGGWVSSSQPMELVALAFSGDPKTADEKLLRSALALSVDRGSMKSVLLQGAGQPTASLLPNWMSGYGLTFSTDADLKRARHEREQVRTAPNWTVGYDANVQWRGGTGGACGAQRQGCGPGVAADDRGQLAAHQIVDSKPGERLTIAVEEDVFGRRPASG